MLYIVLGFYFVYLQIFICLDETQGAKQIHRQMKRKHGQGAS